MTKVEIFSHLTLSSMKDIINKFIEEHCDSVVNCNVTHVNGKYVATIVYFPKQLKNCVAEQFNPETFNVHYCKMHLIHLSNSNALKLRTDIESHGVISNVSVTSDTTCNEYIRMSLIERNATISKLVNELITEIELQVQKKVALIGNMTQISRI